MVNISEISDALTQEALLAKKYETLADQATNPEYKQALIDLSKLSEQKMQLVFRLLNDINWFEKK